MVKAVYTHMAANPIAATHSANVLIKTLVGAEIMAPLHGFSGLSFWHSQYLSLILAVPVRSTHSPTRPPVAHERTTR